MNGYHSSLLRLDYQWFMIISLSCNPAFFWFKLRKYLKQGISVYLNVPLDALAKRIAAVGTDSRPLLDSTGDAYTKVVLNVF